MKNGLVCIFVLLKFKARWSKCRQNKAVPLGNLSLDLFWIRHLRHPVIIRLHLPFKGFSLKVSRLQSLLMSFSNGFSGSLRRFIFFLQLSVNGKRQGTSIQGLCRGEKLEECGVQFYWDQIRYHWPCYGLENTICSYSERANPSIRSASTISLSQRTVVKHFGAD